MADELYRLERDLRDASDEVKDGAHGVVKKGALNVKNDWRKNARQTAPPHARHYPRSISFDISKPGLDVVTAVIGPDKDKTQGALGNLLEFGSVNNPPHNDGGRALRDEEPRFHRAIADLGGDVL